MREFECMKVKVICAHLLSNVIQYSVLDEAGEAKVLERYVFQNSEIKVEKEDYNHESNNLLDILIFFQINLFVGP